MNRMLDPYGLGYRPMMSDAEDVDTQSVVNRMNANQAYEQSPFGRVNAMLTRQTDALEGSSGFNPVNMMLEGAKTANRWLGAAAGHGDRVTYGDMLAPLGVTAMTAPFMPRNALGSAGGKLAAGSGEPQGVRAYHGSPHDFDKFDAAKIGDGEGTQLQGYGFNFTTDANLAKTFQSSRNGYYRPKWDATPNNDAERGLVAKINGDQGNERLSPRDYTVDDIVDGLSEQDAHRLKTMVSEGRFSPPAESGGRLYEVNLNINDDRVINWDQPFSQQTPFVQDALRRLIPGIEDSAKNWMGSGLGDIQSPIFARRLIDEGVEGLTYGRWDGVADATKNYVVFDDKLIDILRKYGLVPGAVTGGAALAGGSGEAEARQ